MAAEEGEMMGNYLEEHGYNAYLAKAEKTLKPCPFCGNKPIYISGIHAGYDEETGRIVCENCHTEMYGITLYGYGMFDPEKAFEKWNSRVGDSDA